MKINDKISNIQGIFRDIRKGSKVHIGPIKILLKKRNLFNKTNVLICIKN